MVEFHLIRNFSEKKGNFIENFVGIVVRFASNKKTCSNQKVKIWCIVRNQSRSNKRNQKKKETTMLAFLTVLSSSSRRRRIVTNDETSMLKVASSKGANLYLYCRWPGDTRFSLYLKGHVPVNTLLQKEESTYNLPSSVYFEGKDYYLISYNGSKLYVCVQNVITISGEIGEKIGSIARSKIGCKYIYGASGPNIFDAMGLVYYCYKQVGIKVPRTINAFISSYAAPKESAEYSDIGDVVVFQNGYYPKTAYDIAIVEIIESLDNYKSEYNVSCFGIDMNKKEVSSKCLKLKANEIITYRPRLN